MFEFHAFKALRWTKATGSDMPKCIVRLVKEVHNTAHNNFTVSATTEGKFVAMDWYSSFPVQIEAIVELNEKERIADCCPAQLWRTSRRLVDHVHGVPHRAERMRHPLLFDNLD